MEVTLEQMLVAREERAFRQFRLSREYGLPLLSFSMNIPGPVKDSPLIRRGFLEGVTLLDRQLPPAVVRYREVIQAVTGCEAIYVLDMEAETVKAVTTAIEDTHSLGRLYDMDVLDSQLNKLDRVLVGGKSRDCIICGAAGRGCASRRTHSVSQLQETVNGMLTAYFREEDAGYIEALAVESLTAEVKTTPKPGLVDCRNNGSHRDMSIQTFFTSAQALSPYFRKCAKIGMETAALPPQETFSRLREAGLEAEAAMFSATGGINTHKGAIFTMGILCGAAGRLWLPENRWEAEHLFREVSAMTEAAMEQDFRSLRGTTSGEQLYTSQGIRGIRGEVASGLPSVAKISLPAYRNYLRAGLSPNDAGAMTLLHLIAQVADTCLIHRGGLDGAREAAQKTAQLLLAGPAMTQIEELDDWFIQCNLSPGGCADLLAATYFIHSLSQKREAD